MYWDVSKDMFNKALSGSPGNISKSTQKQIIQQTKSSPQVNTAIKNCITQSNGANSFSNCLGYDDAELQGDLYYSIQHIDIYADGKRGSNGVWDITIHMEDEYDFEPRRGHGFAILVNNFGYYLQEHELLHTYHWSVSYKMKYKE